MKKKELKQELKAARLIARTNANSIAQLLGEKADLSARIAEASRMNSIYAKAESEAFKRIQELEKNQRIRPGIEGYLITQTMYHQSAGRGLRSENGYDWLVKKVNEQSAEIATLKPMNAGLLSQCKNRKLQVKELETKIKELEAAVKIHESIADNTTTLRNQVKEKDRVIGNLNQEIFDLETKIKEYEKVDSNNDGVEPLPF